MNREERIQNEKERLQAIFSDLDENKLQAAEGLICQASFMLVTLEDLQDTINHNGLVDEYKNGKDQYGTKQSAELQAYNQTLRSYSTVISKLLKIVPKKPEKVESPQERWERYKKEQEEKFEFNYKIDKLKDFCEQLEEEDQEEDDQED